MKNLKKEVKKCKNDLEEAQYTTNQQMQVYHNQKTEKAELKQRFNQLDEEKAKLSTEIQNKIEEHKKLKNDTSKQIDELQEEIKQNQMQIEQSKKVIDYHLKSPSQIYNKIMNTNYIFDNKFKLDLELNKSKSRQFIKAVKYLKLPKLEKIRLANLGNNDTDVKLFLKSSFPDQQHNFTLNLFDNKK